jgi:hypothetical protein
MVLLNLPKSAQAILQPTRGAPSTSVGGQRFFAQVATVTMSGVYKGQARAFRRRLRAGAGPAHPGASAFPTHLPGPAADPARERRVLGFAQLPSGFVPALHEPVPAPPSTLEGTPYAMAPDCDQHGQHGHRGDDLTRRHAAHSPSASRWLTDLRRSSPCCDEAFIASVLHLLPELHPSADRRAACAHAEQSRGRRPSARASSRLWRSAGRTATPDETERLFTLLTTAPHQQQTPSTESAPCSARLPCPSTP